MDEKVLLEEVSQVVDKFYTEIYRNGENFNIYSLLGLERKENSTHSQILADLLSPQGSHGQGNLFLKMFLKNIGDDFEFTNEYVKVSREYYVGKINEDSSEGGRIDILIEIGSRKWVIENKIDAYEQTKQIERYYNAFPNAKILFLTLDGYTSYEHDNLAKKGIQYQTISYETTIKKWLQDLIEISDGKEYLKNSLKQYQNLINNLTYNGYTNTMEKEITQKVSNSLLAGYEINNVYQNAFSEVQREVFAKIQASFDSTFEKENGIITKASWKKYNIGIGYEREDFNLFYGICALDNTKPIEITEKLSQLQFSDERGTATWPIWKWFIRANQKNYITEFLTNENKQMDLQQRLHDLAKSLDEII